MILSDLRNNIKTRRKDSMLQRLNNIKYFFVLVVLLALPMLVIPTTSKAGVAADGPKGVGQRLIDQTDMGAFRLVYFVDRRARESYVQVTNTSTSFINIHVQMFDVVGGGIVECEECDFDDTLTPEDTHVYDASAFVTNLGGVTQCNLEDNHYGFVVISYSSGGDFCDGGRCNVVGGPLIGMFRIIDDAGYEYRTNAAGKEVFDLFRKVRDDQEIFVDSKGGRLDDLINFEEADGNVFSDLVGITFWEESHSKVNASPNVGTAFGFYDSIEIYTEDEVPGSCSPAIFSCSGGVTGFGALGDMDKGIDNSLPNSRVPSNRICSTERLDTNSSGWVHMPFSGFACLPPFGDASTFNCFDIDQYAFFVGFVGLNNGDGTGSMDSWWTQRPSFSKGGSGSK